MQKYTGNCSCRMLQGDLRPGTLLCVFAAALRVDNHEKYLIYSLFHPKGAELVQ